MCEDHPLPGGRRKAGSKNSRALLIAGCLVGLPHISHMVTHMQRGARMELWRGDCLCISGMQEGAETLPRSSSCEV